MTQARGGRVRGVSPIAAGARPIRLVLAIALSWVGCVEPPGEARSTVVAAPTLVQVGALSDAPIGSDSAPRRAVAFRSPSGSLELVALEALSFVPQWRDGAALVDPRGRLYQVQPGERQRMLATGATGSLGVSSDGTRLAFVVAADITGKLRVHDGEREETLARGLASAGVLRFSDEGEGVFFVGARPGGVVGIWLAAPEAEARCLTNCALRTGQPWREDFVPPPVTADAMRELGDRLEWTDPDGGEHEVAL